MLRIVLNRMNHRKLSKLSDLYFWAILALGIIYLASILWVFFQSSPGTLMLIVYLFDARKYGYSLESYGNLSQLWISLGLWLLSLALIWRALLAALKTVQMVRKTRMFVGGLKICSQTGKKVLFDSAGGEIFTAGLWSPKIYISKSLHKMHGSKELKAMVLHELNHAQSRDPLRTTVVGMVEKILPSFPGKTKLAGYFYTLVEVCADKKAEERLGTGLPLITALYKRLNWGDTAMLAGINFFSSQSERIGLLVGRKRLNKKMVLGVACSTGVGALVFAYLVTKVNFYSCPHLTLCLSAISSVLELH